MKPFISSNEWYQIKNISSINVGSNSVEEHKRICVCLKVVRD